MRATSISGPMEHVLEVVNVWKSYRLGDMEVSALQGIDLTVERGEFLVILGASGSGKSTLLNILGGLDVPTSGTLRYLDHDLTRATEHELTRYRREHAGFVFQFYNLIPSLTALENVRLVTEIAANPMDPLRALEMVGLKERRDHFPAQLSGGEQQRVAIARAIAKQPDVLLCDEPTGALDVETGRLVLDAICHVNQTLGAATLVITHNAVIGSIADRIIRLSSGRIVGEVRNQTRANPGDLQW